MAARPAALGVIPVGEREERVLSLPGWQIRITAPGDLAAPLAAVLQSIGTNEPLPSFDLTIAADGRLASGSADGRVLWSVALPRRGWLSLLLGQVGATAAALLHRLLFIHAGAVALGGRGWIVVGESGAGKTSTTAILTRLGAAYLTDEIAVLDAAAGTVLPFALPMAVKPWTAAAVGAFPAGAEVASEGGVRFFLPAERAAHPHPAAAFVLLKPGRRGGLAPLARSEVLMALAQHQSSFRYPYRLEEAFAGFSRLLRGARCYALTAATPAEAAALIAAAAQD